MVLLLGPVWGTLRRPHVLCEARRDANGRHVGRKHRRLTATCHNAPLVMTASMNQLDILAGFGCSPRVNALRASSAMLPPSRVTRPPSRGSDGSYGPCGPAWTGRPGRPRRLPGRSGGPRIQEGAADRSRRPGVAVGIDHGIVVCEAT